MLLVFDQVHFLDPVGDEEWRAQLMREMAIFDDARFSRYQTVYGSVGDLITEGVVKRIPPTSIRGIHTASNAAAAVSDILDPRWYSVASRPEVFHMPSRPDRKTGMATWQIFRPKIPAPLIEVIESEPRLQKHLISIGGGSASWSLSYEAGSAIAMNTHLAAAQEMGLVPITDSGMHHQLLMLKMLRRFSEEAAEIRHERCQDALNWAANRTAISVVRNLFPDSTLTHMPFENIVDFRRDTAGLREALSHAVRAALTQAVQESAGSLTDVDASHLRTAEAQVETLLVKDVREYVRQMEAVRDKYWPQALGAMAKPAAAGGVASVALSLLGGGPGYVLAGSIVATALTILKSSLDVRAELKAVERSESPAVAYLASISKHLT